MRPFLISILIHITVFNLFIFVFPVIPASHKPQFTFLGPILSEYETINVSQGKSFAPKDFQLKAYITESDKFPSRPFPESQVQKAQFIRPQPNIEEKSTLKSTFLPPEDPLQPVSQEELDALGIELNTDPYRPLKFQTR